MKHEPECSGTKICCRCSKELPVIFFSANNNRKDGLESYCRNCQNEYNKKNPALIKRKTKRIEKDRSMYFFNSK
jgi:hypothetical protein